MKSKGKGEIMPKRVYAWALVVAALGATSALGWGSVISSFPPPAGSELPNGIGFLQGDMWLATNTPDRVWRLTTTGSVLASFPSPTASTVGLAVGRVGGVDYCWVVSGDPRLIYRVRADNGSVVGSFPALGTYPGDAAFRAVDYLYYIHYGPPGPRLYRFHATTGSVYASYVLASSAAGMDYDAAGYLWMTGNDNRIRKCTLTGSTLNYMASPASGATGCGFDGTYVWVGTTWPPHYIWQLEAVGGSAAAPASLGEVRALFR
jgi:hypothetical protein